VVPRPPAELVLDVELLVFVATAGLAFRFVFFESPFAALGWSEFKIVGMVKFAETWCMICPPEFVLF